MVDKNKVEVHKLAILTLFAVIIVLGFASFSLYSKVKNIDYCVTEEVIEETGLDNLIIDNVSLENVTHNETLEVSEDIINVSMNETIN